MTVAPGGARRGKAASAPADWRDYHPSGRPRALVPILDNHYGVVLEQGRLATEYDRWFQAMTAAFPVSKGIPVGVTGASSVGGP